MMARSFLFAGGGSGGHVNPGLAIAERLGEIDPDARSVFICSQRPLDTTLLAEAGMSWVASPASPPSFRPLGAVRFLLNFRRSVRLARDLLRAESIDRVVALGGFVTPPVAAAAATRDLPVTLLNLDARPGKANRWVARRCQQVISAIEVPSLPGFAEEVVGMPLRRSALAPGDRAHCRRALGLDPERPTLLVTGASQGAGTINRLMIWIARSQAGLLKPRWQIYHLSGPDRDGPVRQAYDSAGIDGVVEPFQSRMGLAWGAADLAISRAGASSVAEAAANHVPTLFLPYPYHHDEHQWHNAAPLAAAGGAVLEHDRVDPEANWRSAGPALRALICEPDRREAIRAVLRARAVPGAAERIARMLLGSA